MPDDDTRTQVTPAGYERKKLGLPGQGGIEIPVPTRERLFADLAKVAKPDGPDDNEDFLDS
jgi:hypothetical protein